MPCLPIPGGHLCGVRPPRRHRCSVCHRPYGTLQCDWIPPRGRRPCDRYLCTVCAEFLGDERHACPHHGRVPTLPAPGEPYVLVVGGARRLIEAPEAVAWVEEDLVACWTHPPTALVTGDAIGPDTWAATFAAARGVPVFVYALDGAIHATNRAGACLGRWTTHAAPPRDAPRGVFRAWAFARNTTMVAHVARRVRQGARAQVRGYLAATEGTQGTAQMLGVATRSALATTALRFAATAAMPVGSTPREARAGS